MKSVLFQFNSSFESDDAMKQLEAFYSTPGNLRKIGIIDKHGKYQKQDVFFPPLAAKNSSCFIFPRSPGGLYIHVFGEEQDIIAVAAILGIPLFSVRKMLDELS